MSLLGINLGVGVFLYFFVFLGFYVFMYDFPSRKKARLKNNWPEPEKLFTKQFLQRTTHLIDKRFTSQEEVCTEIPMHFTS